MWYQPTSSRSGASERQRARRPLHVVSPNRNEIAVPAAPSAGIARLTSTSQPGAPGALERRRRPKRSPPLLDAALPPVPEDLVENATRDKERRGLAGGRIVEEPERGGEVRGVREARRRRIRSAIGPCNGHCQVRSLHAIRGGGFGGRRNVSRPNGRAFSLDRARGNA